MLTRSHTRHLADVRLRGSIYPALPQNLLAVSAAIADGASMALGVVYSALCNNHAALALLLQSGGNCNSKHAGMTALTAAARHKNVQAVALLLAANANPNCYAGELSTTPLCCAVQSNCLGTVTMLIEHGAAPSLPRGSDGCTPLHFAARCGNVGIARALLAAGAEAMLQTSSGFTVFHVAAQFNNVCVAQCICATMAPADRAWLLNAPTAQGCTALVLAAKCGNADMITLMCGCGAVVKPCQLCGGMSPLGWAVRAGSAAATQALLAAGADPDAVAAGLPTPLAVAAANGFVHIVYLLLRANATEAVGPPSQRPMARAAVNGQVAVVALLAANGTPVADAHTALTTVGGAGPNQMQPAARFLMARFFVAAATRSPFAMAVACNLPVNKLLQLDGVDPNAGDKPLQAVRNSDARTGDWVWTGTDAQCAGNIALATRIRGRWTVATHHLHRKRHREMVLLVLLVHRRNCALLHLPKEMWLEVLAYVLHRDTIRAK